MSITASQRHVSTGMIRRAELWDRVDEAVRLVLAPGPVYFSSAFLAGMATSFLFGLWVL